MPHLAFTFTCLHKEINYSTLLYDMSMMCIVHLLYRYLGEKKVLGQNLRAD